MVAPVKFLSIAGQASGTFRNTPRLHHTTAVSNTVRHTMTGNEGSHLSRGLRASLNIAGLVRMNAVNRER